MPYTVTFTSTAFVYGSIRTNGNTLSVDDNTARMLVDLGVATAVGLVPNTQITTVTAPFASDAELMLLTGTTQVLSPRSFGLASLSTNAYAPNVANTNAGTLGTGANAGSTITALTGRLLAPSAGIAGYATRGFNLYFQSNSVPATYNFSKESGHAIRLYGPWTATVTAVKIRTVFGRLGGGLPIPSTLAEKGYGWEWDCATKVMSIIAHNGTTLTTTALTTPFVPAASTTYDLKVLSNGAGTISMYIDGVLRGTSSGGPTGVSIQGNMWWQTEIQNMSTSASSQVDFFFSNPKVYTVNG